jgi:hypothetical protein
MLNYEDLRSYMKPNAVNGCKLGLQNTGPEPNYYSWVITDQVEKEYIEKVVGEERGSEMRMDGVKRPLDRMEGWKKLRYIVHTNNGYISLTVKEGTRQTHGRRKNFV